MIAHENKEPKWELGFVTQEDAERYIAYMEVHCKPRSQTIVYDGIWYRIELLESNVCPDCSHGFSKSDALLDAKLERTQALKVVSWARGMRGESIHGLGLALFRNGKLTV